MKRRRNLQADCMQFVILMDESIFIDFSLLCRRRECIEGTGNAKISTVWQQGTLNYSDNFIEIYNTIFFVDKINSVIFVVTLFMNKKLFEGNFNNSFTFFPRLATLNTQSGTNKNISTSWQLYYIYYFCLAGKFELKRK